jgi:hypothetical protein
MVIFTPIKYSNHSQASWSETSLKQQLTGLVRQFWAVVAWAAGGGETEKESENQYPNTKPKMFTVRHFIVTE